jgi:hypothetical protein
LNVIRQNRADFEHEKLVHPQTHSHTHKKFITTPKNIDQVPSALFGVFNIHNRQQQLKAATFFKVARSVTQAHTHAISLGDRAGAVYGGRTVQNGYMKTARHLITFLHSECGFWRIENNPPANYPST